MNVTPTNDPVTFEYGLMIDCAQNGCDWACDDDGEVMHRPFHSHLTKRVIGHAVTFVARTVIRSQFQPYRPLEEERAPLSDG